MRAFHQLYSCRAYTLLYGMAMLLQVHYCVKALAPAVLEPRKGASACIASY